MEEQVEQVEVFVEDRNTPNDGSNMSNPSILTTNQNEMIDQIDESEPFTKSELDEIEAQLTGQNTVWQLAEFKARAAGYIELADRIRNKNVSDKELKKLLDDETLELSYLPIQDEEMNPGETANSGDFTPISNAQHALFTNNSGRIIPGASRYTWDEQVLEAGPANDKAVPSNLLINEVKRNAVTPSGVKKEALKVLSKTQIHEEKVASETKKNLNIDEKIDEELMSTDSDLEHVKKIAERAMHSEIDDFS